MLRQVRVDVADAVRWLAAEGFSDGLPVAPPTLDAVRAAVAASGEPGGEVLGIVPPRHATVTVDKAAVCAVMAGCPPEATPVVVAGVRAVLAPPFRVASVQSSTSPATPLLVVDGPAVAAAGMATGTGCFGPGAGTNLAIGRAVRLVMTVVGGARPGAGDPATLGMPAKVGACVAERADRSPWPTLGRRRSGGAPGGTLTTFAVTGMWQISAASGGSAEVAHQVLHGMINPGHCSQPRLPQSGEQLLMVSPPIAERLAEHFPSLADLQAALFSAVRIPWAWVPPAKRGATAERLAELGLDDAGGVPLAEGPDAFEVIVAGGDEGVQSMGLSTLTLSRSATVPIAGGLPPGGL